MAITEHFTDPEKWHTIMTQSSKLKHLVIGVRWGHYHIREWVDAITEMRSVDTLIVTVGDFEPQHDGAYFTPRDKVDLFLVDWSWVNRGVGVSKEEAGEPKIVSWLAPADVKTRALNGITVPAASSDLVAVSVLALAVDPSEYETRSTPIAQRTLQLNANMSSVISSKSAQALIEKDDLPFTLFPKLPLELRLMIWECALPAPRIIALVASELLPTNSTKRYNAVKKPSPSNPVLLFVSYESRTVVLSTYRLVFRNLLHTPLYFDFSKDMLFFPRMTDLVLFVLGFKKSLTPGWRLDDVTEIQAVERLVVGIDSNASGRLDMAYLVMLLDDRLRKLSDLILTGEPPNSNLRRHRRPISLETFLEEFKANLSRCKGKAGGKVLGQPRLTTMAIDEIFEKCEGKMRIRLPRDS
ncbi:hypothetical protein VTL71DRAFT_8715 [Oculimacula yallundae]|uniref:2EXR domain-containing protein n=1 Tax=Oculimacula yallundae TaxID=86028 RepID=A0ABR4CYD8_9HELO